MRPPWLNLDSGLKMVINTPPLPSQRSKPARYNLRRPGSGLRPIDDGMAAAATAARKVTLTSSDGEKFVVDVEVAMQSQIFKNLIEDGCADTNITVLNVPGKILAKVIRYCKKHVEVQEQANEEIQTWDARFVRVNHAILFDLQMAANYLDISSLRHLICCRVADIIKDKTPEELRETFNIKNDFTPEEEEWFRGWRTSERFSRFA